MKKIILIAAVILAALACSPSIGLEQATQPENGSQTDVRVQSVELCSTFPSFQSGEKAGLEIVVGETCQLTATVLPDNASDKTVVWTSSNSGTATVENGLVSAVAAGEAVITASAGGCSASCAVTVSAPFTYGGMCLEAVSDGVIVITNPHRLTLEYKIERQEWAATSDEIDYIYAKTGERVWFRGRNESYYDASFRCFSGDFYLYGNLMSLICGDDFQGRKDLTGDHAFCYLFGGNDRILNHPTLDIELPATTLSPSCYRNMFYECARLTRAPRLPAPVLTEACYASMFGCCTSLKEFPEMAATQMAYMSCTWMMMRTGIEQAPELPATNLAKACYEFMFMECPDLKTGPSILPATELASECYTGMFQRCDRLETAPELPATKLKYACYSHMFNGCASLKKAPRLPATSLADNCYSRMFGNSGLLEAPELPATDLKVMCYQYMFEGSRNLTKAPVLPAVQLQMWCYEYMFRDCSSLSYVKADFLTKPSPSYTIDWLDGVAPEGVFVKNPDATWDVRGANGIPEGWTVE